VLPGPGSRYCVHLFLTQTAKHRLIGQMSRSIATIALLVANYDEAIKIFL
jgi:hypothetical protein